MSNTNYWKQMKIDASDATKIELEKRKEAYEKAHDIRKFEIGLFWQRATYYWAFILAAYTAHFALIGMLFGNENRDFSIPELYRLPGFSLFALAVTSFFCYFFSLCWVLMNKGSKFWQKNWEGHIDELEQEFSGDLYKVIPNTRTEDFSSCLFSLNAYDYSVSKITSLTSVVLMIASCLLFLFYVVILGFRIFTIDIDFKRGTCFNWFFGFIILLFFIIFSVIVCNKTKGNTNKIKLSQKLKHLFCHKKENAAGYWINRDELIKK